VSNGLNAAGFVASATAPKPQLTVHGGNLPATVCAMRDLFAASSPLFDRGGPVQIIKPADSGIPIVVPLTKHGIVMMAHQLCEPVKRDSQGNFVPVTLPERVAQMYLDMHEWKLRPLTGISTAPLLSSDGSVRAVEGYDPDTALWCANSLPLALPARPTIDDASVAHDTLRRTFRTFPFADTVKRREGPLEVVDLNHAPKLDESSFLVALMTAVCRSSLWLAPGFLVTAPAVSGAGSGKGLLVRAINAIAFGAQPRAFTMGGEKHELDKRLAAELVEAQPALFLDNANSTALRSDTLASVLTERPARVRILGETRMVSLNSTAFVAITGNALGISGDLARRFVQCELDAGCEDPESRPFAKGAEAFLEEIMQRRSELLTAVLTIWRYGRQNNADFERGKPLGSFETWAEWCRDPLLALGSRDPIERIQLLKSTDPKRQRVAELFTTWWTHHGPRPMAVNDLAPAVKDIVDPQNRGRQYLAVAIGGFVGTRAAGLVLNRQPSAGRWTPATYALLQDTATDRTEHRTHQTNGFNGSTQHPMSPMPDGADNEDWVHGSAEEPHWPDES
jgi:putative DNA primase/helicase